LLIWYGKNYANFLFLVKWYIWNSKIYYKTEHFLCPTFWGKRMRPVKLHFDKIFSLDIRKYVTYITCMYIFQIKEKRSHQVSSWRQTSSRTRRRSLKYMDLQNKIWRAMQVEIINMRQVWSSYTCADWWSLDKSQDSLDLIKVLQIRWR